MSQYFLTDLVLPYKSLKKKSSTKNAKHAKRPQGYPYLCRSLIVQNVMITSIKVAA